MSGANNTNTNGEPNTETNSEQETTSTEAAETTQTQETETVEVDLENETVKAAIAAKVEDAVKARLGREKDKVTAAEAKATAAETKFKDAEAKIATLTSDMDSVQAELKKAVGNVMVYKLSIEEKVSPEIVNSLKGDNEAELRAAIQKITKSGGGGSVNHIFDGKDTSKTEDGDLSAIVLKAAGFKRG